MEEDAAEVAGLLLACAMMTAGFIGTVIVLELVRATTPAPAPAPERDDVGDQAWQVLAEARRITEQAARER